MPDNQRIEDLRRRVQRDPASIAFAQLAEEYRRAGQFDEAVQVCRAGLAIHPGYLSARVTLGRSLLELGQLEAAQNELQMVLSDVPDNLPAIRGLAEVLHRRGSLVEALGHYQRALGLARNDPDLEQTVADLARQLAQQSSSPRAPTPATSVRAMRPGDLLTLEQLTTELKLSAEAAARPVPPPLVRDAVPAVDRVERDDDRRVLPLLERWLTAIDGVRADRRA
jgi:tetratricopeptide (TPR) repeat protein